MRLEYGKNGHPPIYEQLWDKAVDFDRVGDEYGASLLRDAGDELVRIKQEAEAEETRMDQDLQAMAREHESRK